MHRKGEVVATVTSIEYRFAMTPGVEYTESAFDLIIGKPYSNDGGIIGSVKLDHEAREILVKVDFPEGVNMDVVYSI